MVLKDVQYTCILIYFNSICWSNNVSEEAYKHHIGYFASRWNTFWYTILSRERSNMKVGQLFCWICYGESYGATCGGCGSKILSDMLWVDAWNL